MARGAILLGLCGAMSLAGCSDPAVPDSATGTSSALANEVVAVTRLCVEHGFARWPVDSDLRRRGFGAWVPLVPMLYPANGARLSVMRASPCTLYVKRSDARLASDAVENELRRQGFRKSGDPKVWTDGARRVRVDRQTVLTARNVENNVAFSLTPG